MIRVPSIDVINNELAGSAGLKVVSTFAGGGGSSTGYKMAGYKVPVALEFVDKAAATYRANAPSTTVIERDIRTVQPQELLELAGVDVGELDVLDGSPPCQTFSTSGLREKAWGEEVHYSGSYHQRSDDLFFEFTRMLGGLRPKTFVAENVSGLFKGVAKGYFAEIHRALEAAGPGYRVVAQMVQAHRLGVPQKRERVIFIGVRKDLLRDPVFPRPLPASEIVSVAEAIADIPSPPPGSKDCDWLKEGSRTRMAWEHASVLEEQGCFTYAYRKLGWSQPGKEARFNWFKLPPNQPCPTITGKVPCLCHWAEPRTLSIQEAVRLQSFPDDFRFADDNKFKHRWERVGRSVPPLMMAAIAGTIRDEILKPRPRATARFAGGIWQETI